MISHEHKCIFIHIPRTAGTSIEKMICGKNWWKKERSTKHITAKTAKELYSQYWDEYFKFSFVRNPYSRLLSLTKWPDFYGCKIENELINIDSYIKKHHPIEIDPRSKSHNQYEKSKQPTGSIYQNILDEELDFIGKFENLKEDIKFVTESINSREMKLPHLEAGRRSWEDYRKFYSEDTIRKVQEIHSSDMEKFGYSF